MDHITRVRQAPLVERPLYQGLNCRRGQSSHGIAASAFIRLTRRVDASGLKPELWLLQGSLRCRCRTRCGDLLGRFWEIGGRCGRRGLYIMRRGVLQLLALRDGAWARGRHSGVFFCVAWSEPRRLSSRKAFFGIPAVPQPCFYWQRSPCENPQAERSCIPSPCEAISHGFFHSKKCPSWLPV